MQYEVHIVDDADVPEGESLRQIVELKDGGAVLLISGVYAECWRYMRAWEDMHEPCTVPSVLLPAPAMLHAV